MNAAYFDDVEHMLKALKKWAFRLSATFPEKTLEMFNYTDILQFKNDFGIDALRIDYGFQLWRM